MKQQTKDATPSPSNSLKAVIVGKLDCPINEEQTELFHQGQWKEIQEDQDGEKYFMDGMQTVYFEVSPSPSIPVKEGKLKKIVSNTHTLYGHLVDGTKVFVIGESWHGYEGAIGYQELTTPYYDIYLSQWEDDKTESLIPVKEELFELGETVICDGQEDTIELFISPDDKENYEMGYRVQLKNAGTQVLNNIQKVKR